MLRLFSSIRKTLINEGKTSRYVRYAVGEVLLIMVGIILALQFQNWNQNRLLAQDRRELVENLKEDFLINQERLNQNLESAADMTDTLLELMNVSVGESKYAYSYEELRILARKLFGAFSFRPVLGTYQSAVATGDITLIKDTPIIELMAEFEDHLRRFTSMDENARADYFMGSMYELRKQIGAVETLSYNSENLPGTYAHLPERYSLSEEEFRDLISQKEVYAIIANRREFRIRGKMLLSNLKEITQQILIALEELD